ncbi:hypothetical protein LBMAG55_01720 [Verrucomicrobiota bacterium]|nr:hypothetical protein LBMAG55_01720 [Verrucomicrobiota bacterium]
MSEIPSIKPVAPCKQTLQKVLDICLKKGNCTMEVRAQVWLTHGGDKMDISPANFHLALAEWLGNAGLVKPDDVEQVAAALYCLGVTNSNNLFQKVHQGKMETLGIGRSGRRNSKSRRKTAA